MRRAIIIFSIMLISAPGFCIIENAEYIPGEVLIKFRSDVEVSAPDEFNLSAGKMFFSSQSINSINKKHSLNKISKIFKSKTKGKNQITSKSGKTKVAPDISNIYKLNFPKNSDIREIIKDYEDNPGVIYAEPNYIYHTSSPNDIYYNNLLNSTNQWGLFKIGLITAELSSSGWSMTKGATDVVIAIIDTGVAWNHPDLGGSSPYINGNIWINWAEYNGTASVDDDDNGFTDDIRGWDFVSVTTGLAPGEDGGPRDNNPMDFHGHGTHCSGIASAITNNSIGIAGAGWNCKIMAVRAGYKNSSGDGSLADADVAEAIEYAANMEADIISMSFGGPQSSVIKDAIDTAYAKGCLLIAAAGNDDWTFKSYPAAYNNVMAVAATNRSDNKASYSNYGSSGDLWVDVSAPGGDSDYPAPPYTYNMIASTYIDDSYAWMQGTSMACPLVAGVASLVKSKYPSLSNDQIFDRIVGTADNIGYYSYPGDLGSGRINANNALTSNLALISSPFQGSSLFGITQIIGTATWEGAGSYTVSTAEGTSPSSDDYIVLNQSSDKIFNDVLAVWDTTGLGGFYSIKLSINSSSSTETIRSVRIGSDINRVKIIGDSLGGPNPYNPSKDPKYIIHYNLSANSETKVLIFDLKGTLLWQKKFLSGSNGARQGDNKVEWFAQSNFNEELPNGVYVYQIVANDTVIGRGKIIILR